MLANIATALKTTSDYLLGIETDEFRKKTKIFSCIFSKKCKV